MNKINKNFNNNNSQIESNNCSQAIDNNINLNNNKLNNNLISQETIDNKALDDKLGTYDKFKYKCNGLSTFSYLGDKLNDKKNFSFINHNFYDNNNKMGEYQIKKHKASETSYNISILITAAENIIRQGFYALENTNNNTSEVEENIRCEEVIVENVENNFQNNLPENEEQEESEQTNEEKSETSEENNEESIKNCDDDIKHMKNSKFIHLSKTKGKDIINHLFLKTERCENKNCNSASKKNVSLIKRKICKGKFLWLCNFCIKAWNCGQYCFYCFTIYKDSNINSSTDGKDWILCDGCDSWV